MTVNVESNRTYYIKMIEMLLPRVISNFLQLFSFYIFMKITE